MNLQRRLTVYFLPKIIILLIITYFVFLSPLAVFNLLFKNDVSAESFGPKIIENTIIQNNKVIVKEDILQQIAKENIWIQILNAEGYEIFQFDRPKILPSQYSPGELILQKNKSNENGYTLFTNFQNIQGQKLTWVFGEYTSPKNKIELILIIIGIVSATIMASALFSNWISKPLGYILLWLQDLSKGLYSEPNKKGDKSKYEDKNRNIKKSYVIYKEVIFALNKLTTRLSQSEKERQEIDKLKEEWITGVSHDIKTPLSVIKGYSDLLSTGNLEWNKEEIHQFSSIIQERSCYIEELINEFNLIFKLKNNALLMNKKEQDIIELLRESVIDVANTPKGKDQNLEFYTDEEELYYPVDKLWFRRAIDNFLTNAIVHNPPKTNIKLSIHSLNCLDLNTDSYCFQIIICDDGIGMDSQTQSHLFERYYRGTDSSSDGKSTGLGMAIAKQLIQAHQGELSVNSELNKGTKIVITFMTSCD